ncbi:MAG: hypothetical protein GXX96_09945 [Planctomycetaceae bacterium]|nr:hypothetical protein [Planctomycetaceae bacterium]
MSTTIIDRRHSAGETTDPEVEHERMARRRAVRAEAAKLKFEKDKLIPLEAVVAESHQRVEAATELHQTACVPLQAELETLEVEAVERIANRKKPDPKADQRRADILRELAAENAKLEQVVETEKHLRAPTEREIWRLRNRVTDPAAVLGRLAQPPAASPELLAELHVARERIKWLRARQAAAEKTLRICQFNATEIEAKRITGDLSIWRGKTLAWEHELAAVGDELASAMAEAEKIHKSMLDE